MHFLIDLRPPGKAMTFLMLWCLVAFAVGDTLAQQSYKVFLQSGTITPSANFTSQTASNITALPHEVYNGRYQRLVQFSHLPDARSQTYLQNLGVKMQGYVDFGAYFISVPKDFDWSRLVSVGVRSVEPVAPEWKIARALQEQPYPLWAWNGQRLATIVSLAEGVDMETGARLLRAAGYDFRKTLPNPALIYVNIKPDQLKELAALPFVNFVEPIPPAPHAEDDKGRALHRANLVDSESSIGPKFTGAGVGVLVRDDGAVGPHIDFQGRITNIATEFGPTHGDGVSGILCGAGNLDPDKRGMAAGAELFVIDYVNNFQDNTLPLHVNDGVKVTNSSYSDGCNTGYTAATRTVDKQIFENPTLMHVFSAGNSGTSNCDYGAGSVWGNITGGHKQAKNAIATANLNQQGALETSSSRGPAYDGRLKPDIAANGAGHLSTDEQNTYLTFGGTSGAAPGIAGCMTQLIEAYRTFNNGQEAPTALIKAIMLNTANDQGNIGPDYKYGWGHVNSGRALRALQNNWFGTGSVNQGQEVTIPIQVPTGAYGVRVMVYWPEAEAAQQASKSLINDLDIQIIAPNLSVELPWRLDPTADASILDTPASRGRDSLNNIEQVEILNPASGTYTLKVLGTAIPSASADFYYVYEFVTEPIHLTYPNGGEGVNPGQNIHIQWDAIPGTEPFELKYSIDGGANWTNIANPGANSRLQPWTLPPGLSSGQVLVSVSRGTESDQSDTSFTITPLVQGFDLVKVCPDSVTVKWNQHATATDYEVYSLGQKYMEIVGATTDTSLTFYKLASFDPLWLSVRPRINGAPGRRLNAKTFVGQLTNCPQAVDYATATITQPAGGGVFGCDPNSDKVQIRVENRGLQSISGLSVSYTIDQNPPVTEPIADLAPNNAVLYTFAQPMVFPVNGAYTLRVWVNAPGDLVGFNDTLTQALAVSTQVQTGYFAESFEGTVFPPEGYRIVNPDNATTWERSTNITGLAGNTTRAMFINHFDYDERGEEDQMFMIPIDLTTTNKATLAFDLAHAGYDATYSDGLRVSIYRGCSLNNLPDILFDESGSDLNTSPNQTSRFIPNDATDWSRISLNLDSYLGDKVLIAFTALNDFGNNTYIDNINLSDEQITLPVASIFANADTICRLDTVVFSAPTVAGVNFEWNFGSSVQPSGIATGPGPHARVFLATGDRIVRLIASNQGGSDTAFHIITSQALPNGTFTQVINQNTVNFTATSAAATQWLWDFGDGNTSNLRNPVHTYASVGTYTVTLGATNKCRTDTKSATVNISTVGTQEALAQAGVRILPNPNQGNWSVGITRTAASEIQLSLLAIDGRLLRTTHVKHPGSGHEQLTAFEEQSLSPGAYLMEIKTDTEITRGFVFIQK